MKRIFLYLLLFIACQQNTSTNILYSSEFDDIQYFGEDLFLLEGTVDAVHFTDIGFIRYSTFLIEKFKEFNLLKE